MASVYWISLKYVGPSRWLKSQLLMFSKYVSSFLHVNGGNFPNLLIIPDCVCQESAGYLLLHLVNNLPFFKYKNLSRSEFETKLIKK